VVRLSRRTPSDSSSRVTHLLTTEVDISSRRAAPEKLRASTTRANTSIAARSIAMHYPPFANNLIPIRVRMRRGALTRSYGKRDVSGRTPSGATYYKLSAPSHRRLQALRERHRHALPPRPASRAQSGASALGRHG